ncbi:MAG TPA: IS200/IS605 family transposase [Chthonomonadaceae bacterium]|nr:IS200/IS605 family transposase [Chthonomonadaceae bacterium]
MREPYTQLYVHLVWATWDRLPLITEEIQPQIYACIKAECESLHAEVIALGGIANHVHLLARIPTTISIGILARQVKGASSHLITHHVGTQGFFKWQGGYGAFTVSKADVPRIRDYIYNQETHHRDRTLDAECEPD